VTTQKDATQTDQHSITVILTDEEYDLLEAFAAEQDIENLSAAIPAMIHELVRLHDALWDAQFARSRDVIDKMAAEALEEHRAGLTEDFDPSSP
jgi:hypothetical protein